MKDQPGTVYLVHFDERYEHARHYLGWTNGVGLEARLECHARGYGSRLLAAVARAGIEWKLVRVWVDKTRAFERQLKGHSSTPYCPACVGPRAHSRYPEGSLTWPL